MATILDKDIVRESTVKIDDREINVTLTSNQEIKFKLKGMKSGELTISIEDLYNQLSGRNNTPVEEVPNKRAPNVIKHEEKVHDDAPMINLHDLRSLSVISCLDIPTMTKFDGILAELIKNDKERKKALKESSKKK